MDRTSLTLLQRLKGERDELAWKRFESLYRPLLAAWARRFETQESDIDDLIQDVFLVVSRELSDFDHAGRPGSFRCWLRRILANRLHEYWRARRRAGAVGLDPSLDPRIDQLADDRSALSQLWERQHDQYVLQRLLVLVEPHFTPTTWQAFCRVTLSNERPDEVAAALGINTNAVFIAKSRVLTRLRREAAELDVDLRLQSVPHPSS